MSLLEKMKTIIGAMFSSFLSIEVLLFCFLLFLLLIINIKVKNKIVPIGILLVISGLVGLFFISFYSYVQTSIDSFLVNIMNYIYFPSTIVFFFIILVMVGVFIYSILSRKLSGRKKVFNYLFCLGSFYFFSLFIHFALSQGIDFADKVNLYKSDTILVLVQGSNLLFVFWFIVTVFYQLYLYFKRKFDDKEKIES